MSSQRLPGYHQHLLLPPFRHLPVILLLLLFFPKIDLVHGKQQCKLQAPNAQSNFAAPSPDDPFPTGTSPTGTNGTMNGTSSGNTTTITPFKYGTDKIRGVNLCVERNGLIDVKGKIAYCPLTPVVDGLF